MVDFVCLRPGWAGTVGIVRVELLSDGPGARRYRAVTSVALSDQRIRRPLRSRLRRTKERAPMYDDDPDDQPATAPEHRQLREHRAQRVRKAISP